MIWTSPQFDSCSCWLRPAEKHHRSKYSICAGAVEKIFKIDFTAVKHIWFRLSDEPQDKDTWVPIVWDGFDDEGYQHCLIHGSKYCLMRDTHLMFGIEPVVGKTYYLSIQYTEK